MELQHKKIKGEGKKEWVKHKLNLIYLLNYCFFAGVKVNQANVIEADIGATNGVIHAIDKLLVPPEFLTGNRRRSIR